MLGTVLLLVLCAVAAIAGIPLILRLVPPNDIYGFPMERRRSRPEVWYRVNRFAGWALVVAAVTMVVVLVVWSNTLLRPFWLQLLVFALLAALAFGATLLYEQELRQRRKTRVRRSTA